MAILKTIEYKHMIIEKAVIIVEKPAETYNNQITLAYFSNKESLLAGEMPLYNSVAIVPENQMQILFTENALKAEGVTARSQSYVFIKSLPDFLDCEDLIFSPQPTE